MNRKDQFEKSKITKASTNKVVTNVYYDAFNIEKAMSEFRVKVTDEEKNRKI